MNELTINYVNNLYHKQSKAKEFEIYFIINKTLYKTTTTTINDEILKFDTTSVKKGSKKTLRLRMLKQYKQSLLDNNKATKIMTEKHFKELCKQLKLNKGECCEYLSHRARHIEYARDNVRYDKAGDINTARKTIQVKFQNATIANIDTILKLANV